MLIPIQMPINKNAQVTNNRLGGDKFSIQIIIGHRWRPLIRQNNTFTFVRIKTQQPFLSPLDHFRKIKLEQHNISWAYELCTYPKPLELKLNKHTVMSKNNDNAGIPTLLKLQFLNENLTFKAEACIKMFPTN